MKGFFYGFLIGMVTASLGAYKDTTFEPFEIRKFFRSPIITGIWFMVLQSHYKTQPVLLLAGSSVCLERMTVETWKALSGVTPGKFTSPTLDKGWLINKLKA